MHHAFSKLILQCGQSTLKLRRCVNLEGYPWEVDIPSKLDKCKAVLYELRDEGGELKSK